jgi:hypothetical protein
LTSANRLPTLCHLPCTVETGIHQWRAHFSNVTATEGEHSPTEVGYDAELQSGQNPGENHKHADELPWDGFWRYFCCANPRFISCPGGWSQTAYGRDILWTFNYLSTALVDITAVSMPIALSLKTWDICGIVMYDKTAHFRVAFIVPSTRCTFVMICCLIRFLICHTCQLDGLSWQRKHCH